MRTAIVVAMGVVAAGGALVAAQTAVKDAKPAPKKGEQVIVKKVDVKQPGKGDYKVFLDGKVVHHGTLKNDQGRTFKVVVDGKVVAEGKVGGGNAHEGVYRIVTGVEPGKPHGVASIKIVKDDGKVVEWVTQGDKREVEVIKKVEVGATEPRILVEGHRVDAPPAGAEMRERFAQLEQRLRRLEDVIRRLEQRPLPPLGPMMQRFQMRRGQGGPDQPPIPPLQGGDRQPQGLLRQYFGVAGQAHGPMPRVEFKDDGTFKVFLGDKAIADGKVEAHGSRNVNVTVLNGKYKVEVNGKVVAEGQVGLAPGDKAPEASQKRTDKAKDIPPKKGV